MKVRIKFEKQGSLRFIGHLDVMRYFQKLNRRAQLNVKYSAGFSPHQEMSFATPLGLGLTSSAEYADIEFIEVPHKAELIEKMNAVNVPEMRITEACLLPDDAKNAMSLLAAADYTLTFREGHEPEDPEGFLNALIEFYGQEEIIVEKQTKTNTVTVDLKKQIRILEKRADALFMQVDTGSHSNLKPELVISTFCERTGREYDPYLFCINRDELYGEADGRLIRLIDYGTDF